MSNTPYNGVPSVPNKFELSQRNRGNGTPEHRSARTREQGSLDLGPMSDLRESSADLPKPRVAHYGASSFARGLWFPMLQAHGERVLVVNRSERNALVRDPNGQWTYALIERGPEARPEPEFISNISNYLITTDRGQNEIQQRAATNAAIDALADPNLELISVTITESAYCADGLGRLDRRDPVVTDCLRSDVPLTAIGLLTRVLHQRFIAENEVPPAERVPLAMLPLDNMDDNGNTLYRLIDEYAHAWSATGAPIADGFREWLSAEVAFPDASADRIVEDLENPSHDQWVRETFGSLGPNRFVITEPVGMYPLVISGHRGNPVLERLGAADRDAGVPGAELVPAVKPFRIAKRSIVNASHLALGLLGELSGYQFVDEAMENRVIVDFITDLQQEFVSYLGTISSRDPKLTEANLARFTEETRRRFANPDLRDELARVRRSSYTKMGNLILPAANILAKTGHEFPKLKTVIGLWIQALRANAHPERHVAPESRKPRRPFELRNESDPVVRLLGHDPAWFDSPSAIVAELAPGVAGPSRSVPTELLLEADPTTQGFLQLSERVPEGLEALIRTGLTEALNLHDRAEFERISIERGDRPRQTAHALVLERQHQRNQP